MRVSWRLLFASIVMAAVFEATAQVDYAKQNREARERASKRTAA